MALTIPQPEFLSKFKAQLALDEEFQQLMNKVQRTPLEYPGFKLMNGLLFFKEKLFIPAASPLKQVLLEEFHSSLLGGHSGIHRTYGRLQENIYWNGMRKDVSEFVKSCLTCQQTKPANHSPFGLLQPLPVPERVWEDISLDFITGLPSLQNNTVILVVVDRLSKAAHFGMLPSNFMAVKVVELFSQMVCKLHGMPRSMVSNRDPIFLSHFWQDLFRLSGTKLRMSTAYHPQSDGQTEIVNKVLQQYLRCFVHHKPNQWGKVLHWAEWHYNTAVHTSTGFSPFQVVYGRPPPSLADYIPGTTQLQAVDSTLLARDEVLQELKKKLLKAQTLMTKNANQHRTQHQFKIGDWVFVKLRPYRQNSVVGKRIHKLSKRFYGPYKVIRAVGEVAFQLELPLSSKIHPVFHVSKLKPCFNNAITKLDLPPDVTNNHPQIRPLAVMDWKWNEGTKMVLIQWEGLFPEYATWEDFDDIQVTYPEFHLEDKVNFDGMRDVMEEDVGFEEEEGLVPQVSTKRISIMPKHLKDYVVHGLKKGSRK